jgi:hypothetical protein
VVLWNSPDGNAAFAGWIGRESKLIRKLMMFAPAHLMTTHYFDFGAPIAIRAP